VLTVQGSLPHIDARAAYLLDMTTGNTLVDIHGELSMPMASTTKIMTALIAIQTADPDRMIPVTQSGYDRVHVDDGSSAGLAVGERIPLKDMLYGMMLNSGNDAAISIAEELGGTRANFVERMNLFAYHLRLFQTHFANPDGLSLTPEEDAQHYTSAHDLARLTQYALTIPTFAKLVDTKTYHVDATKTHRAHDWENTNPLLSDFSGSIGVKTGHTYSAGWCLVFAAKQHGHYLLGVVLDSSTESGRETDAVSLLKWGFALPMVVPV
jgi:D-alanyl-D-alanine carboxypeptidase (penicillin-binding protein 5/6)